MNEQQVIRLGADSLALYLVKPVFEFGRLIHTLSKLTQYTVQNRNELGRFDVHNSILNFAN